MSLDQALKLLVENRESVCRLEEGNEQLYLSLEKVLRKCMKERQKLTTKLEKKEKKIHKLKKEIQSWKSWAEEEEKEEEEEEDWDEEVETYLMEDGTEIWVENDDVFNSKTGDWMGNTDDLKVRI